MTNVFELTDVTYRYPESTVLDGLSLSIASGECVAVLGAGSLIMLKVIAGAEPEPFTLCEAARLSM